VVAVSLAMHTVLGNALPWHSRSPLPNLSQSPLLPVSNPTATDRCEQTNLRDCMCWCAAFLGVLFLGVELGLGLAVSGHCYWVHGFRRW
jgi:hypothetical protein